MRKYISYFVFALAIVGSGFYLHSATVNDDAIKISSIDAGSTSLVTAAARDEVDGVSLDEPIEVGQDSITGRFDDDYTDVFVYLYINDSYINYERFKTGTSFEMPLDFELNKGDKVHVDIGAYNARKTIRSNPVIVGGENIELVAENMSVPAGPFTLEKPLQAGEQSLTLLIDKTYQNSYVYVYVNGDYQGGRYVVKGGEVEISIRNQLREGDNVHLKRYSYKTREVIEGTTTVLE
ncbi:hypothetical protein HOG48_05030 [Candidatus Peregrinibacteria bacterium]|nr:hypothetical protein [Candidatus Peregrinibacteria bacterium]